MVRGKKILIIVIVSIIVLSIINSRCSKYKRFQCGQMLEAIEENDITRLEFLLKVADPNSITLHPIANLFWDGSYQKTPLQLACYKGNLDIIKLLLKNGADINYCPRSTYATPLGIMMQSDSVEKMKIIDYLIEKGADVDYHKSEYKHPGHLLLAQEEFSQIEMDILKKLLKEGTDPEKKKLLQIACIWKHEEAIRLLVEEWGYDASDPKNIYGYCYGNNEYSYETFEYFLQHGANPYEKYCANKYQGEKSAIEQLKEKSPEWAEKLEALAKEYGFEE